MNAGIYIIRNKLNYKFYVGRSSNVKKRFSGHLGKLRRNIHENTHLQNSWNKYGEDNFEFILQYPCESIEDMIEMEQVCIDEGFDSGRCYNISRDSKSSGVFGKTTSEETKQKLKLARQNSDAVKRHIEYLISPEVHAKAIKLAATPEARAKAVETRRKNGNVPFAESRQRQIEKSKKNLFAALDWAVANNATRSEAIEKFGSSWGSLKKFQPEWEEINGKLMLPMRASGEKSGAFKDGKSAEKRRKKTPEELEEVRKKQSERMKGENNPMFGKTHSDEVKALLSDLVKNKNRQPKEQTCN